MRLKIIFVSVQCVFFYISIQSVSKYNCFVYCKFPAQLENKIIILQSAIFNGILVHIANRKKWVKDIKRNPTEETEMANKYIKIYLILPLTRQMKSKTRYHFIIILAKIIFVSNIVRI